MSTPDAIPLPDPDPRPLPPEPPLPSDCCDSGCCPCVHDIYSEDLQYYREQLAAWLERHPDAEPST
ncbi:MAG: oxidoreductase-like domain-containing protein [Lysobacteraceae bacterium]|nr:oxidoreductase-like protein [Gammaproteobacteria bacterium]